MRSGRLFSFKLIILATALFVWRPSYAADQGVPPGSVITIRNWRKYSPFMSYGLQALFSGKYFWKMPADVRLEVGPTHHYPPPQAYLDNTRKYGDRVKIVTLPNGEHTISGYVAGAPFPNPAPPMKGWKILVDMWYRYIPWLICGNTNDNISRDRFGNTSHSGLRDVLRRLSHISDVGMPITDPQAQGMDTTEQNMVKYPEQAKYTTNLTIYYTNPLKREDLFLFIPALRRSLRLSDAARCAPFVGTDFVQDDIRGGWNGGFTRFSARYIAEKPILDLTTAAPMALGDPNNFYPSLIFPTPKVGKWELRGSYIIDVRRIPSQQKGYCYGKQIMYIDKETSILFWKDVYDANMRFWKALSWQTIASPVPREGEHLTFNWWLAMWDMQNEHMTEGRTATPSGQWYEANENCRNYEGMNFDNVAEYSTAAGLALILR